MFKEPKPHPRVTGEGLTPFARMPLSYTAYDSETTGLPVGKGRGKIQPDLVTVGITRVENGQPVETQEWKIRPLDPIDPQAALIHGITDEQAHTDADFRPFEDLWPEIRAYLSGETVIIHNAPFDQPVLNAALRRRKLGRIGAREVLDSCWMARAYGKHQGLSNGGLLGPSLDKLTRVLGVEDIRGDELDGMHGAGVDTLQLAYVLEALRRESQPRHVNAYNTLAGDWSGGLGSLEFSAEGTDRVRISREKQGRQKQGLEVIMDLQGLVVYSNQYNILPGDRITPSPGKSRFWQALLDEALAERAVA